MTTPTPLQQLARETAESIVSSICVHTSSEWGVLVEQLTPRILTALEQVSREERKEAEALAVLLNRNLDALRHMNVCADCASDSWSTCEGGRSALAVIEDTEAALADESQKEQP